MCFSDCPQLEPLPLGAIAAGEQAVVADAVENFGQDVEESIGREPDLSLSASPPV